MGGGLWVPFWFLRVPLGASGRHFWVSGWVWRGLWGPVVAILAAPGTSGTVFPGWRFVGFERSGKSEHMAAEGRRFPVSAFLDEFHFFRKLAASPEKASIWPQRGGISQPPHEYSVI